MLSIDAVVIRQARSHSQRASTPLVNDGKVRTLSGQRSAGTATTNSSAPTSMPAALGWSCVLMAGVGWALFLRFLLMAFFVVWCGWLFGVVVCLMRGQLPKNE